MGDRKFKAVATGWGIQSDEAGKQVREGQKPEYRDRDQNPGTGVRAQEQREYEPGRDKDLAGGGKRGRPGSRGVPKPGTGELAAHRERIAVRWERLAMQWSASQ